MQDHDTCHRIRSVHQRGGAFQYFNAVHATAVNLYAVFVAPLLTFLSYAFTHHYYAVIAQSADDRFRDTATCSQLADSWLVSDGIDDIRRSRSSEYLW